MGGREGEVNSCLSLLWRILATNRKMTSPARYTWTKDDDVGKREEMLMVFDNTNVI
jgi:hypothetical protein